ncbi:Rubrerythrin [Candidatus Magnetomoraceae bacterium gMMP-15]
MSYVFNADEVFEMAEQLERNGADFYKSAAEDISDSSARELLLNLAKMEEEHEKTFAMLKTELTEKDKESTIFDPEGEAALYLRALADTRVFFEKEIDTSSMQEILKAALVAEKDSIVFYLGMKDLVSDKLGKNKINNIIKEEMGHIKLLGNKLAALKK